MGQPLQAWSVFGTLGLTGLSQTLKQLSVFNQVGQGAATMLGGLSGTAMLAGAGIAAVGLGTVMWAADGIKNFARFDDAMTHSLAIMGDVSDTMRNEMEFAAREMAKTFRVSAEESAEAFYHLASAGLSAAQSIAALPAVTEFATAGNFGLEKATELLVDAQISLGLSSADATENLENMVRVSDVLVKANAIATGSTEQFAEALSNKAAARMRQLNIEIEEGVAILAVYAQAGAKGRLAGERLSIVLRDLPRIAVSNADAFKRWGIDIFDTNGQMNSFVDITKDFEKALAGKSAQQKAAILIDLQMNEQLADGITALIGMSDRLAEFEAQLKDAAGTTEEVANNQMQSISAQWDLFKNKITDADFALGNFLRGPISWGVGFLNDFADVLNHTTEEIEGVGAAAANTSEDLGEMLTQQEKVDIAQKTYFANQTVFATGLVGWWLRARLEMAETERQALAATAAAQEAQMNWDMLHYRAPTAPESPEAEEIRLRGERMQQWARERAKYESQIGITSKNIYVRMLREELAAQIAYSDEWKSIQKEIIQTQHQMAEDARQELEKTTREAKTLADGWLAYQLETGAISTQARIAKINEELATVRSKSDEELELLRERFKLQQEVSSLEADWLQYRIEIGEVSKEARVRQLLEEIEVMRALGQAGGPEELAAWREADNLIADMTANKIADAKELAEVNRTTAVATLEAWRATLVGMQALTPAIDAAITEGVADISKVTVKAVKDSSNEVEQAARGLGEGIIRGIISGSADWSALLEQALTSILTSIVMRVGFKALGIASPSTLTIGWGRNLMQGLAIGFNQEAAYAASAMSMTAGGVMDTIMNTPMQSALSVASRAPVVRAGGLSAGITVDIPLEKMPKALTPFEVARDSIWLNVLGQSLVSYKDRGGRG